MELLTIFETIKDAFDSLWTYKVRGNSIEIITPYATTNDMFISVFITLRGQEFVVSDGGWLSNGGYDTTIAFDDDCFTKLYYHYEHYYDVKSTSDKAGNIYYFKKTSNIRTVSNIVYDLTNFISAVVSSSLIQFQDVAEREEKAFFTREANAFIESIVPNSGTKHNQSIGEALKNIRFSTIITYPKSKLTLVSYVTGSNYSYFQSSIARANLNFEIAAKSQYNSFIRSKIAFINDKADGFKQDRLYEYLNELERHTDTPNIKWSEREKLQEYL